MGIFQSEFSGSTGIFMEDWNKIKFLYIGILWFYVVLFARSHRVHIKMPCALISKHTAFSSVFSLDIKVHAYNYDR